MSTHETGGASRTGTRTGTRAGRAPLVVALAALAAAPAGCEMFEDEPTQQPAPEKPAPAGPPKATRPTPKGEAPAKPATSGATSSVDSTASEATSGLESGANSAASEASGAASGATSTVTSATSGVESSASTAASEVEAPASAAATSGAASTASSTGSSAAGEATATGGSTASGAASAGASAATGAAGDGASSASATGASADASTASSMGSSTTSSTGAAAVSAGSMAPPAASEARAAAPASIKGYVLAVRGGASAPEWVASLGEGAGTVAPAGAGGTTVVVSSGEVGCAEPRVFSVSSAEVKAGKAIPDLGHAAVRRAVAFGDGSTVATGARSQGGDLAGQDLFLERFDGSGDPASFTTFGGPRAERGGVSCEAPDSGVFLAGSTSTGPQDEAAWVMRVAADGHAEWEVKQPAEAGVCEEATDVAPAPDGGCVAVGTALSANKLRTTIWARRYGRDGKIKWAKAWATPREVYGAPSLCEAQGGGAWLVAAPVAPDRAFSYGDWQTSVARLDDTGAAAWEQRVPGRGSCVVDTPAGPALAVVAQEGKARVVNIVELTPEGQPRSRTPVKAAGAAEPRVMRFADGAYVIAGPMQ